MWTCVFVCAHKNILLDIACSLCLLLCLTLTPSNTNHTHTRARAHTHTHTHASFKQGPPGGIVNSQQIVWRECEMGRREMMERCADRREGAPEGEAMISGGGRASEEWKNKRVCGCCYLKGLDKVSVTGSVRSSSEADMAARLSEVRLMGLKVTDHGVHTRLRRCKCTAICNTYLEQGDKYIKRLSHQHKWIRFGNQISCCLQTTASYHHISLINFSKSVFFFSLFCELEEK